VDHPISLYAATKKANELMAHTYSHLFALPTTGLRFFTVYGPWGRPDMALFLFTRAILEGRPIDVFNFGKMRRDFTYVDDIVEGVVRVMDRSAESDPAFDPGQPDPALSSAPYRLFNIGNQSPVELMAYIEAIEEALGKKAKRIFCRCRPATYPPLMLIPPNSTGGSILPLQRQSAKASDALSNGTENTMACDARNENGADLRIQRRISRRFV
jgi:UDP-glucuronate 4-epimerase